MVHCLAWGSAKITETARNSPLIQDATRMPAKNAEDKKKWLRSYERLSQQYATQEQTIMGLGTPPLR